MPISEKRFWRGCVLGQLSLALLGLTWLVLLTSNRIGDVRYFALPDDGMISMRYARNLAAGLGLVWNPGERIEGFTNPLWTLLMSLVHLAGCPGRLAALPLQLASVLCHLATAWYLGHRIGARTRPVVGFWATLLYLSSSCATMWAISGWETSACVLLWTLALDPVLDPDIRPRTAARSLLVAGAAVWLRPDAGLLLVVLTVYWLWVSRSWSIGRWILLAASASWALPLALGLAQLAYYGSWTPNTAMLKRSAGLPSLAAGVNYVVVSGSYPVNLLGFALGAWGLTAVHRAGRFCLIGLTACYGAYVVFVGGDAFEHARFLVPLIPTALSAAALRLSTAWQQQPRPEASFFRQVLVVAVVALVVFDLSRAVLISVPREKSISRLAILTALSLHEQRLDTGLVGVFAAGTVPYFLPNTRFHDMLGKNDAHIAGASAHSGRAGHNRWDYDYSLGVVRPDLLVTTYPLPPAKETRVGFRAIGDYYQDLADNANFQTHYQANRRAVSFNAESVTIYEVYARR